MGGAVVVLGLGFVFVGFLFLVSFSHSVISCSITHAISLLNDPLAQKDGQHFKYQSLVSQYETATSVKNLVFPSLSML